MKRLRHPTPAPCALRALLRTAQIAIVLALAACSSGTAVPPIEQPFGLAEGQRVHGRFAVREQDLYSLELAYPFDDAAQRSQAWRLAGGEGGKGPAVTLHVQVSEIREARARMLRSQAVTRPGLTSWDGRALHAELLRLPLSPGIYTYDVRVVDAAPTLQQARVRIVLREAGTDR